jgi:hypothetical protein
MTNELDSFKPSISNSNLSLDYSYINLDRKSQVNNKNYIMGVLRKNSSEEDSYTYAYKDHQEDSR